MLSWIKSLFTDVPAGTLMVAASLALVATLMFALGEIAASQPEPETLYSPHSSHASESPHQSAVHPVSATLPGDHAGARGSSVSVMVPVGAYR